MFLQCFVALRIKSRLAKVASAESSPKMRDQKRHAGAARSTCGSQNVKNTSAPEHVCNQLWCEAHVEFKSVKTDGLGPLLEAEAAKKCTSVVRSAFNGKNARCFGPLLDGASQIFRGRRNGFGTLSKVSKTAAVSKKMAAMGRWQRIHVARQAQYKR